MNKDWLEYDANWEWASKFYIRIICLALLFFCFILFPKTVGTIVFIRLILWLKKRVSKKENNDDVVEHCEKKITFQDYMDAQIERNRREYEKELTHNGKLRAKI